MYELDASEVATQLKPSNTQAALHISGKAVGGGEVGCLVVMFIYRGHVKSYISHKQQVLVLSRT